MEQTAGDIMTTEVVTTSPAATVSEVAGALSANRISGMPVVDAGQVVGIISEVDILGASQDAMVESLMVSDVISVEPDVAVEEVAMQLADRGIKRVPVIDSFGNMVGIVSRADIVAAMAAGL